MRSSSRGWGTPMSAEEALGIVKKGRMVAEPNKGFLEQLGVWEGCGFELWEEGEGEEGEGGGRKRKTMYEELVRRVERERERRVERERQGRGEREGRFDGGDEPWAGRRSGEGRGGQGGRQAEEGGTVGGGRWVITRRFGMF